MQIGHGLHVNLGGGHAIALTDHHFAVIVRPQAGAVCGVEYATPGDDINEDYDIVPTRTGQGAGSSGRPGALNARSIVAPWQCLRCCP